MYTIKKDSLTYRKLFARPTGLRRKNAQKRLALCRQCLEHHGAADQRTKTLELAKQLGRLILTEAVVRNRGGGDAV